MQFDFLGLKSTTTGQRESVNKIVTRSYYVPEWQNMGDKHPRGMRVLPEENTCPSLLIDQLKDYYAWKIFKSGLLQYKLLL